MAGHRAVRANEEGLGDAGHTILNRRAALHWPIRVGDAELAQEAERVLAGVPHSEAHEDDAPVAVATPGALEHGRFSAAGWAPGCPEVDQDHLAALLREPEPVAGEERELEIRRRAREDAAFLGNSIDPEAGEAPALAS